jgi:transcriptional regulator with XRE-family HTH domain
MTIDYKNIGKRVRANRIQQRMTQAELAEKTGMSDVYISNIERGAKRTSLDALLKIVYVLEISLDSLVLDDSSFRLPKGYREFWELLADCDINERTKILRTASAYKKVLREGQR